MSSEFGGGPRDAARRAVAVLAALDTPEQGRAAAVREALERFGEDDVQQITDAEIDELDRACRRLRPVVAADDVTEAAAGINALLRAYGGTPRVTAHGGHPWHLHVDADDEGPIAAWFMASTAMALAVLLTEWQQPPLRQCASPECGRVFVRSTQGAPRRYCSTTCGTRERVARLRARSGASLS